MIHPWNKVILALKDGDDDDDDVPDLVENFDEASKTEANVGE